MKDNISAEGWAAGLLIMFGLPLLGYMFGGWKWAIFWFVIPQLILIFAKIAVNQKR